MLYGRTAMVVAIGATVAVSPVAHAAQAAVRKADTALQVRKIVAEQIGLDLAKVAIASDLMRDLGADELDMVELVIAVEDAFGVQFSDAALDSMRTVGDLVVFVEKNRK